MHLLQGVTRTKQNNFIKIFEMQQIDESVGALKTELGEQENKRTNTGSEKILEITRTEIKTANNDLKNYHGPGEY